MRRKMNEINIYVHETEYDVFDENVGIVDSIVFTAFCNYCQKEKTYKNPPANKAVFRTWRKETTCNECYEVLSHDMIKKIIVEVENGLYPDGIAKKLGIDKKEVVRLLCKHLIEWLERFQELSEEILKEEK